MSSNSSLRALSLLFASMVFFGLAATSSDVAFAACRIKNGCGIEGPGVTLKNRPATSNSGSNAGAILGLGAAMILQGLSQSDGQSRVEPYDPEKAHREGIQESIEERRKPLPSETAKALRNSMADPANNPWASAPAGDKKKASSGTAPFADPNCVSIAPRKNRGAVDWDYVTISNKCAFPVQVLTCFSDRGEKSNRCDVATGTSWGTSDTIKPKGSTTTVTTSRTPKWEVKYIVCNMTKTDNRSRLCVRPKNGAAGALASSK